MFRPSDFLQGCAGICGIMLSFGAMWGMISGSVVKGKIAGANFSVNDKLNAVDKAYHQVEDAAEPIQRSPKVPKSEKQKIQRSLENAERIIGDVEEDIAEDMSDRLDEY